MVASIGGSAVKIVIAHDQNVNVYFIRKSILNTLNAFNIHVEHNLFLLFFSIHQHLRNKFVEIKKRNELLLKLNRKKNTFNFETILISI